MKSTNKHLIDQAIIAIATTKQYKDMFKNILKQRMHLKAPLLSLITLHLLDPKYENRIVNLINNNELHYYISTFVKLQVMSSSSPLFLQERNFGKVSTTPMLPHSDIFTSDEEIRVYEIDEVDEKELKLQVLDDVLESIKLPWFERQIFKMKAQYFISYREMEKLYGIGRNEGSAIYNSILNKIKEKYIIEYVKRKED